VVALCKGLPLSRKTTSHLKTSVHFAVPSEAVPGQSVLGDVEVGGTSRFIMRAFA
jgi:hypothetical protein